MDLQKLEADLLKFEQAFRERNSAYWQLSLETAQKRGHDNYTEEDRERELEAFVLRQNAVYNPSLAIRPLLNEVILVYSALTTEERAAIRDIFQGPSCASYGLLDYILDCAARLKRPEDDAIFHSALVAASIENCAHDFRDTSAVLADLLRAASKAEINIESHSTIVAELSSDEKSKGGCPPMKTILEKFHSWNP